MLWVVQLKWNIYNLRCEYASFAQQNLFFAFRNTRNSMFEEKNLSSSTRVKSYLLFCCNSKGILYSIDTWSWQFQSKSVFFFNCLTKI